MVKAIYDNNHMVIVHIQSKSQAKDTVALNVSGAKLHGQLHLRITLSHDSYLVHSACVSPHAGCRSIPPHSTAQST